MAARDTSMAARKLGMSFGRATKSSSAPRRSSVCVIDTRRRRRVGFLDDDDEVPLDDEEKGDDEDTDWDICSTAEFEARRRYSPSMDDVIVDEEAACCRAIAPVVGSFRGAKSPPPVAPPMLLS